MKLQAKYTEFMQSVHWDQLRAQRSVTSMRKSIFAKYTQR